MLGEIHHVEIEASDAREQVEFFGALGYEVHRTTDHHGGAYELRSGTGRGPIFEVHTVEGEEVPGINHIALVTDDLAGVTSELVQADVDDVAGPFYLAETGRVFTNVRDPDGRRFQIVAEGTYDPEDVPEGVTRITRADREE